MPPEQTAPSAPESSTSSSKHPELDGHLGQRVEKLGVRIKQILEELMANDSWRKNGKVIRSIREVKVTVTESLTATLAAAELALDLITGAFKSSNKIASLWSEQSVDTTNPKKAASGETSELTAQKIKPSVQAVTTARKIVEHSFQYSAGETATEDRVLLCAYLLDEATSPITTADLKEIFGIEQAPRLLDLFGRKSRYKRRELKDEAAEYRFINEKFKIGRYTYSKYSIRPRTKTAPESKSVPHAPADPTDYPSPE